jgi:methionyl-tRNA formyltransferase
MKIGILASGELGLSVLKRCVHFLAPVFIATDSKSITIIQFSNERNIPVFIGNPRNGKLKNFLMSTPIECDVLISINYLFLLEKDVISMVDHVINFHGSLLPKYRGRTPHVWAIINNEKITGVTAHLIDESCDTGDIILQKTIDIKEEMTGAEILNHYETIYPELLKEVYDELITGKLNPVPQDHFKATYYGKRTPEDGQIDWNWQRERIKNWVRAQAYPYPGAFSYIDTVKLIVDEIKFSDFGFHYSIPNGTILQDSPAIIVKTPNGSVELSKIRNNKDICKKDKVFKYENRKF